ncbi:hypothetical protein [Flavivirga aquatica]|nr:hypothetical protein [Flavivirga aquatica]
MGGFWTFLGNRKSKDEFNNNNFVFNKNGEVHQNDVQIHRVI